MATLTGSGLSSRAYALPPHWFPKKGALLEIALAALILAGAVTIRLSSLDAQPLWVDEAESSINALTILKHGYPTDSYLGLPIYENTLVQRWPDNREYEFRDLSYSEKHFAVYHGWFPLYSIAASFALERILPDEADGDLSIKHGVDEWKRRTRAARLPAVLFGAAFLIIAFCGASVMYGRDAGWAALILGAIHPWHFALSRQARYYSAQITLTTACCVLLWLMLKRCTWKLIFAAALAFILLFHTHLLGFSTAIAVFLMILPLIRRQEKAIRKVIVFTVIVAAGTLPWIIITGFYAHESAIPRAWPMLQLPADLFRFPPLTSVNAAIGIAVLLLLGWLFLLRPRVSSRVQAPVARLAPPFLFLGAWAACSYTAFLLFMPAVSFAVDRLNLSYWGPLFLLEAAICAALARVLTPRVSTFVAPLIILLLFFAGGNRLHLAAVPAPDGWKPLEVILTRVNSMHLMGNTRLYAAPNGHLVLTFYSGLPIQDITPVRKAYLDDYKGDIVYIDTGISVQTGVLTPDRIHQTALRYGQNLSPTGADRWMHLLRTRDYREEMLDLVAADTPRQLEVLPAFAQELLRDHHRKASALFSNAGLVLVTRGFNIQTWNDWRAVLKYRFVAPAAHSGIHANYADRLRGADVITLPEADSVLYYSRWHRPLGGRPRVKPQPPAPS